ncbi:MAG: outer membrane lipoprotein carrier protein LolA [Acidobacteria bacterium]|nr:outer membrane lipoprotein carrier protein LolA [Acidobacteriota bacterium]
MVGRWRYVTLTFAAALLFAAPALPAVGEPPADPKSGADPSEAHADPLLARILQSFDRAQRETSTLIAGFTERKDLRLLARPVVSRGELYYNRPNQVRWEYLEPDRKVFVITEDRYLAYYPALKRAEEVPIRKFVGKRLFRFIGLGQSIEELGKYYEFRLSAANQLKDTHLLVLVPRKKKLRERVAEMKIWVDAATHLPRQLQYVEADGDSTLLTFRDVRSNVEVAAARFRLALPKDVVVSDSFNGFSLGEQSF